MLIPSGRTQPSESTIEVLSNHYILNSIGSPPAWILVPTRNEEKEFNYDAALRNVKAAVIQYKRVATVNTDGGVSIRINVDQHRALATLFSSSNKPHAFYAFSKYHSYDDLDRDYLNSKLPKFFKHMLFVDVHSFEIDVQTLRLFKDDQLRARMSQHQYSQPIHYWRGPDWVSEFTHCNIGLIGGRLGETFASRNRRYDEEAPRLNLLLHRLPDDNAR